MYNLLIIDDEPRIVNGLYEQFLDWRSEELNAYRAYSAFEALTILAGTKMDIVLTDIQMPGMSGIELQQKIHERWPRCKVIFLTGYSDFEWIQSAMRNGGMDYILKVEGDEPILAAVGKAIDQLKDERVSDSLLQTAKEQMQAAGPMLRKEYLAGLLQGELGAAAAHRDRFAELDIPLSAGARVLLAVGRVDRWPDGLQASDKSLLLYALRNISEEYLNTLRVISFPISPTRIVWLIQPAVASNSAGDDDAGDAGGAEGADWDACTAFVRGTMSDIQETCRTILKLPLSVAVSSASCPWSLAAAQYMRLEQLLQRGFGQDAELLLSDPARDAPSPESDGLTKQDVALRLKAVKQLEALLLGGQKEEFFALYDDIADSARALLPFPAYHPFLVELEYAFASLFLSYMNQWGLFEAVSASMDAGTLLRRGAFVSWAETEDYYRGLSVRLFELRAGEQQDRTRKILNAVNQYIEQHLSEDLSLDRLADHVYLHPTYLSRLYRQMTGIRLSDHIKALRLKKAKELLASPRLKIHEVSASVGFESAHYFTKVFKKELHMTPQEYRDRLTE
ncbi:response regulator [Cohnella nanjingensis]|uniref:Response regulator n=1 Tax=Cohnella nanjingensis TaxID=1387779 RepID=A0A7X0RPJ1_9BACL|nr:response regulator [Cohnella nanjingensis]MBB6671298.1 response regulator [Cohnella nanjingensis]